MIIKLQENKKKNDVEVLIEYPEMSDTVRRIQSAVRSVDSVLPCGGADNQTTMVKVSDVFYIESVDKRTFAYTKDQVYNCDLPLYQCAEKLYCFGFVQISKSCVLNIGALTSVRPIYNSKMEALLSNGEKLHISRKYLPLVKKKLEEL